MVKLVLMMLLLSIISGAIILGVALNEQRQNMEKQLIEENKRLAEVAARSIEAGYVEQTWPFRTLNQINDSEDVLFWWIVDPDGEIYLADNPGMQGKRIGNASIPASSEAGMMIVKDYVYSGENIKFLVQPLHIGEPGKVWSLCTGISLKSVNAAANRMIITSLGYFSLIIAFACVLSLILAVGFTKPIMQLVEGTKAISRGDFDANVEIKTGNEIEGLGNAFNKMAAQVKKSIAVETAARREIEDVMQTMLETLIVVSPEGDIRKANKATLELLGYKEDELIGKPFTKIMCKKEAEEELERLLKEGSIKDFETTYLTKDGREIPVSFSASSLKGEKGKLKGVVCVAGDITERKRAEAKIQASLREKEELMREIHHRVKNNLQIVSSLLDMQARRIKDKKVVDSLSDSRSRIQTMSLIHTQLYQSENLEQVEMGVTIRKLVNFLLQIYAKDGMNVTTVVIAKDVKLPISQAIPCALIINELVSNALKHAFEGMAKGSIEIAMRELAGDKIELTVKDNGAGIPEALDIYETRTLGLKLVRTLAEGQLKGEMEMNRDEGTKFCIKFDLTLSD